MKRKISLILVLAMVLSVMLPFGALAAEENADEELYEKLKEKIGTSAGIENIISAAEKAEEKNFYNLTYKNAKEVLKKHDDLKTHLQESMHLTETDVEGIITKTQKWMEQDKYADFRNLLNSIANIDGAKENEAIEYIGDLRKSISKEHSELISNWNEEVLEKGKSRSDFVLEIYDAILESLVVKEQEDKSLVFYVKKNTLKNQVDAVQRTYLQEKARVTDEMNYVDATVELVQSVQDDFNKKLIPGGSNKIVENIFTDLGVRYDSYTKPSDDKPSTGGGGGTTAPSTGGGGSTTPAKPETPPAKIIVTDESIKAVLGEDDIKVTKKDGVATVEVEEDKALATVEAMAKEAEERDAVLVVEAKDVEDMNAAVSLPGSVALELEDKKVNVEIVTKEIEYNVPYNAINTENVDKNSKIELRSKEVTNDLTNEIGEVKSAVDLSMVLIKDKKETVITNFNAPIEVRINVKGKGSYEKLAAYYLNEEDNTLEFVSGHIEDAKLIMKLDHFSKYVIIESTKTFPDIADHWAKENVESMVAKNIINGYEDGTFRPEEKITRAEFVKMIVNALNAELVEYDNEFSDVKASDWHADYIATANELGLINGYTDGTFRPNATIKRAEMASILAKVAYKEVCEEDIEALKTKFNDYKDIPEWALESVAKVVKAGLMNGTGKGFSPNNDTTRAEGATTVYRVYMK